MKFLPASLLCLILLAIATGSQSAVLTLKECLQSAETGNPALKAAAWDSRIAQENVRLSMAAGYPRIDAQAGYTAQLNAQAVRLGGVTAETQEPDFAFAGVSLNYTLYDFGRRSARQQQTQAARAAVSHSYESRRSSIALQVIETYFRVAESDRRITAAREEVARVDKHRRVAQVLFEEGAVTRNDVLQADVRLAAARQKLLTLANLRENQWLLLNFLTGRPAEARGELDDNATLQPVSTPDKPGTAHAIRHDLQALRHEIRAREFEVAESRESYYPELFTRLGLDYVQNDKVREQTLMSATVGIRLSIFDGFASSSVRERAVHNLSRSRDTLRNLEAQTDLEIATARNDAATAEARIEMARAAISQSEENLRITRERYLERVGTATDVMDAQSLATQAKSDYHAALYDHQTALARLLKASGEL